MVGDQTWTMEYSALNRSLTQQDALGGIWVDWR